MKLSQLRSLFAMLKAVLLVVLCFLPVLAMTGRPNKNPFVVRGRVYCDTCLAGFETSASTYIPGMCMNTSKIQDSDFAVSTRIWKFLCGS